MPPFIIWSPDFQMLGFITSFSIHPLGWTSDSVIAIHTDAKNNFSKGQPLLVTDVGGAGHTVTIHSSDNSSKGSSLTLLPSGKVQVPSNRVSDTLFARFGLAFYSREDLKFIIDDRDQGKNLIVEELKNGRKFYSFRGDRGEFVSLSLVNGEVRLSDITLEYILSGTSPLQTPEAPA